MRALLQRIRGIWRAWRTQTAPLPRVRADIGVWVPGWVLRAAAGVLAGLAAGLGFALDGAATPAVVAGCVWFVWTVLAPGTPSWVTAVVLLAGVHLAVGVPTVPVAAGLGLLAYAACRATWWAAQAEPTGRVSLRALGRAGRRDLAVLGVSVVVAGLAWALDGVRWAGGAAVVLGLGSVAVVALGVGVAVLLRHAT